MEASLLTTVVALNMMVLKSGYTSKSEPMFYNYLKPLTSLDEGLYALPCEEDVRCLGTLVNSFKLEDVVLEDYVSSREDGEDAEHGIDNAYETEYDVQSSEDVGTDDDDDDVDVINVDGFDSDPGNDVEKNYRKRRLAELRTKMEGVINASGRLMTHNDTHACLQSREIKHCTYKFLSEKIFDQVRVNLDIPVKAVQDSFQRIRALQKRFVMLRCVFFHEGVISGQVLKRLDLISNNGIYPLAYALVEAESRAKSDLLLNNICEVLMIIVTGPFDAGNPTCNQNQESIKKEAHIMKVASNAEASGIASGKHKKQNRSWSMMGSQVLMPGYRFSAAAD
ncbi:hypothetical protein Tco_0867780 [Tanacetum coccineum]